MAEREAHKATAGQLAAAKAEARAHAAAALGSAAAEKAEVHIKSLFTPPPLQCSMPVESYASAKPLKAHLLMRGLRGVDPTVVVESPSRKAEADKAKLTCRVADLRAVVEKLAALVVPLTAASGEATPAMVLSARAPSSFHLRRPFLP